MIVQMEVMNQCAKPIKKIKNREKFNTAIAILKLNQNLCFDKITSKAKNTFFFP